MSNSTFFSDWFKKHPISGAVMIGLLVGLTGSLFVIVFDSFDSDMYGWVSFFFFPGIVMVQKAEPAFGLWIAEILGILTNMLQYGLVFLILAYIARYINRD